MKILLSFLILLPLMVHGQAFQPNTTGVVIAASNVSSTVAVPNPSFEGSVRVFNDSMFPVFFKMGGSTVTASASDTCVAPRSVEIFSIAPSLTYIAVILTNGTGTIYVSRGSGI